MDWTYSQFQVCRSWDSVQVKTMQQTWQDTKIAKFFFVFCKARLQEDWKFSFFAFVSCETNSSIHYFY